jgi:hypothetical protein
LEGRDLSRPYVAGATDRAPTQTTAETDLAPYYDGRLLSCIS